DGSGRSDTNWKFIISANTSSTVTRTPNTLAASISAANAAVPASFAAATLFAAGLTERHRRLIN
ncbi:MAG: hypothetical protein ACPG5U_10440, partial [Planktomarina sp.]